VELSPNPLPSCIAIISMPRLIRVLSEDQQHVLAVWPEEEHG